MQYSQSKKIKEKMLNWDKNTNVRILAIILNNFKSFAKETVIPFYNGFNAIVGPNGSGKSNIVDAFVFVLGSSSREIRAERLEHVIYRGGYGKKGAEYAEVTLLINNKDRIIKDIEEDIIRLSRKIIRGGSTYYKINNKISNKDKVIEILEKIGIDTSIYNIIQQGDVLNIIKMKPKERREIIDKVAGIDEYNKKKERASKELELAEENLKEINIILNQKKEFLEKLKEDRDLALKVKELEEKKEMLKARKSYSRYKIIEKEIKNLQENIIIKEKEYLSLQDQINKYDSNIENLEDEIKNVDEKMISSLENEEIKKINEVTEKIYSRENKIKQNENEIGLLYKTIENYKKILNSQKEGKEYEILELLKKENIKIHGLFKDIIEYDPKFSIAIEIAMGSHNKDVVVETTQDALMGISFLKKNKLGRARFLPLDRIKKHITSPHTEISKIQPGIIGLASEIINYKEKYTDVVKYVFKDTLIAETAEDAKRIKGIRIVTLDGELFETSGAIVGGYTSIKENSKRINIIQQEIKKAEKKISLLKSENERLNQELDDLNKLLKELKIKQKNQTKDVSSFMEKKRKLEKNINDLKYKRKQVYEKKLLLESEINKLKIRKARLDAEFDNIKKEYQAYEDKIKDLQVEDPLKLDILIRKIEMTLREIGPVNMKAIEDYEIFQKEYKEYEEKLKKLNEEKESIEKMIEKIEEKRKAIFMEAFEKINKSFSELFKKTAKGDAKLELERDGDIDSGLIIKAQPNGKKLQTLELLSGGEKSLVSLTFLFAIMHYRKAPFYLLDEVDAALDKKNSEIIGNMIAEYSKETQFIVISHNDVTVKKASHVYGVTMQKGTSQIFSVVLNEEKR